MLWSVGFSKILLETLRAMTVSIAGRTLFEAEELFFSPEVVKHTKSLFLVILSDGEIHLEHSFNNGKTDYQKKAGNWSIYEPGVF